MLTGFRSVLLLAACALMGCAPTDAVDDAAADAFEMADSGFGDGAIDADPGLDASMADAGDASVGVDAAPDGGLRDAAMDGGDPDAAMDGGSHDAGVDDGGGGPDAMYADGGAPFDAGSYEFRCRPADGPETVAPGSDLATATLLQVSNNGAWSWYQDPRSIVDPIGRQLVVGSTASKLGHDGVAREADVDVTGVDLATDGRSPFTLANVPSWRTTGDDHNTGAFYQRSDGRYLAVYTGHNEERRLSWSRISTDPHSTASWGPEVAFDWAADRPGSTATVTYTNLIYLSAEERLYNIAREFERSPIISLSTDEGETFALSGQLTRPNLTSSYSNGYFRYASNGVDRIDFIATEHHPRDFNTGIYHGYIRGGASYDSFGNVVDDDIFDDDIKFVEEFTPVFVPSPEDGVDDDTEYHRAWTVDIEYRADGYVHALFTTRYGTDYWPASPPRDGESRWSGSADHRLFYARFDGSAWTYVELGPMGRQLYDAEQDYTGLGALDPDDDTTVYISTPFDPRDLSPTPRHEIYRGTTADGGAAWSWSAVTQGSTVDNLRPIVPSWSPDETALLFFRGDYQTQFLYDMSVMALIDRGDCLGRVAYVDADTSNTRHADGTPLMPSVGAERGLPDGTWHERRLEGLNGESVLASGELGSEDAPSIRTELSFPDAGVYEVYAMFWAKPLADWRIAAAIEGRPLQVFRHRGAQQTAPGEFVSPVVTERDDLRLYRAYLGRVDVSEGVSIHVVVDDAATESSTAGAERTWYDGLAFAWVGTAS